MSHLQYRPGRPPRQNVETSAGTERPKNKEGNLLDDHLALQYLIYLFQDNGHIYYHSHNIRRKDPEPALAGQQHRRDPSRKPVGQVMTRTTMMPAALCKQGEHPLLQIQHQCRGQMTLLISWKVWSKPSGHCSSCPSYNPERM